MIRTIRPFRDRNHHAQEERNLREEEQQRKQELERFIDAKRNEILNFSRFSSNEAGKSENRDTEKEKYYNALATAATYEIEEAKEKIDGNMVMANRHAESAKAAARRAEVSRAAAEKAGAGWAREVAEAEAKAAEEQEIDNTVIRLKAGEFVEEDPVKADGGQKKSKRRKSKKKKTRRKKTRRKNKKGKKIKTRRR